jgi:hypothetical protein
LALDGKESILPPDIHNPPVELGDEVFVAGMFIPRVGELKNIPIIRQGTVAAMPEEPLATQYGEHDAYLVEVRSIDGLSGSPLFVPEHPMIFTGKYFERNPNFRYHLIGMVLGHSEVQNPTGALNIEQTGAKRRSKRKQVYVGVNVGIAIAIPITHILEAINQPILRKNRERAMKDRKQKFVADSAPPQVQELPTKPDIPPTDAERFTSLVTAAARKKPQDD